MGLELDWLEREERYRRRVVRLMTVAALLVAALIGTLAFMRTKAENLEKAERARAAEAARVAAIKRVRDAFVADSSAAANRYAGFQNTHAAKPLAGLPLLEIPLPPGTPVLPFVQRLWAEYSHVVDPQVSAAQESDWYSQNYIETMNDGPLRGRAVLLPALEQEGTKLSIQHASFTDITRGQVEIGMREQPKEAPPDTTGMGPSADLPPAAASSSTPPASPASSGAPPVTAPSTPPASGSTPSEPVPAASAPPETTPSSTPKDSVPKP